MRRVSQVLIFSISRENNAGDGRFSSIKIKLHVFGNFQIRFSVIMLQCNTYLLVTDAGVTCYAWSRHDDVHPLSCSIALSAVCVRDLAPDLVFPAPEADIEIEAMMGARVSLRRRPEAGTRGWRAAYSLQAWPRDNNSRRQVKIFIFLFSLAELGLIMMTSALMT